MIKFSIVTPTILRHSLVRLCRSIESQSCASWQHVVIIDLDDLDSENPVLRELSHPQRLILKCAKAHRNYGNACRHYTYSRLTGENVMYVDDDDFLVDEHVLRDLKDVTEPWALFPILRHGVRSYSDAPVRACSCSLIVKYEYAQWPDSEDYDADGLYLKRLIDAHIPGKFLPEMRPLISQPDSGGLSKGTIFQHDGRNWFCTDSHVGGYHWMATTEDPKMCVTAASWDQLVSEIKSTDPANPRIDAVAVCDPIPGIDLFGRF